MKTGLLFFAFAIGAAACASDPKPAVETSSSGSATVTSTDDLHGSTQPVGVDPAAGAPRTNSANVASPTMNAAPTTAQNSTPASSPAMQSPQSQTPTTQAPAPDNTRINDRDRSGTLTPVNQGNSAAETQITAAIRRGVMAEKTLSLTAKNVKIITVGTTVTLRGPVKNDHEKALIESLAKQAAGVTFVDNQLDVKN